MCDYENMGPTEPITISIGSLMDFFLNGSDISPIEFIDQIIKRKMYFYMEMVNFFLRHNTLDDMWYTVIHEAEPIIQDIENKKGAHWIMKEFMNKARLNISL